MLLLVTGSSCSGKSTAARGCIGIDRLAVHDSDERGVPSDADIAWRQGELRYWVQQATALERLGEDLLLTSQSPIGELLAVPETESLSTAVCLLDVDDATRLRRLNQRDPGMWSAERKHAFVAWGHWHRGHAGDPTHHPEVITRGSASWMRWDRWQHWTADHPQWHVDLIDCSELTIKATQNQLANWVRARRSEAAKLCGDPGSRNAHPGA